MAKKRPTKKTRQRPTGKRVQVRAKTAKSSGVRRKVAKAAAPKTTRPVAANPVRELAQRIVDLTIRHEDEQALAFYADNVESIEPGMPPMTGIEAIKQKFTMWRGMVSDSSWKAPHVCVDGNTILIEWNGRITLAATGKQVDFNEVAIHEVENGKIVRERFYYNPSVLQP